MAADPPLQGPITLDTEVKLRELMNHKSLTLDERLKLWDAEFEYRWVLIQEKLEYQLVSSYWWYSHGFVTYEQLQERTKKCREQYQLRVREAQVRLLEVQNALLKKRLGMIGFPSHL